MFDDLIPKRNKVDDIFDNHPHSEYCPLCGSTHVEFIGGWIVDSNTYIQRLQCKSCTLVWKIIFDPDLNITNIEIGGKKWL